MDYRKDCLTVGRLKQFVEYDPETGIFTWKPREVNSKADKIWNTRFSGKEAGTKGSKYVTIAIYEEEFRAHRLAYLYMNGVWPSQLIDHINGDPRDNRWENLRIASKSQNAANAGLWGHNRSGVKGVSWCKCTNRWRAIIRFKGKNYRLGRFDSKEEAGEAYRAAADRFFGEYSWDKGVGLCRAQSLE